MQLTLSDNGGRRQEGDRRQLVTDDFSPDRRSGNDRRMKGDRRKDDHLSKSPEERRQIFELLSA